MGPKKKIMHFPTPYQHQNWGSILDLGVCGRFGHIDIGYFSATLLLLGCFQKMEVRLLCRAGETS